MPRRAKGPRLYPRERHGRPGVWVIRDGETEISTECGLDDRGGAEKKLQKYLAGKHQPSIGERDPAKLLIADVLNAYGGSKKMSPTAETIAYHMGPLVAFWTGTVSEIKKASCAAYGEWRTGQDLARATKNPRKVTPGTARRELETLAAALNAYHAEHTLVAVPVVTLPEKAPARYQWLTRSQVAAALWDARKHGKNSRHLMRFILIGVYTGSRHGTITGFRWVPSTNSGWIDVDREVFYRRGSDERETNKRRPPARVPTRLLAHLRRWHRLDMAEGITHVIHHGGKPVKKVRKGFERTAQRLGWNDDETPHVLRHTCTTWLMQRGAIPWEVAGFLGMSMKMLDDVYGHHHPDHQSSVSDALSKRNRP